MCRSMVDIQSPTADIRRGKKRKKKKIERNYRMKILRSALLHRATIISINHPSVFKDSWLRWRVIVKPLSASMRNKHGLNR